MANNLIPAQECGSKLDVTSSVTLASPTQAEIFYQVAKQRLLNVNGWDEVCGLASSTFRLINKKNQEIVGSVREGDYIRIDIPGPGTKTGEGFDWVRVEKIIEEVDVTQELISVTVRPCSHPLKPKYLIAHFFQPTATSTFQVKRAGNTVHAEVHGRNELPNHKHGSLLDKVRNGLIGTAAKLGFSWPQWKLLVEGLIKPD